MNPTPRTNSTFNDLAHLLGDFRQLGFPRWFLRVRTVAFAVGTDTWVNYATSAVLLEHCVEGVKNVALRSDVKLVESCFEIREPLSGEALREQLVNWQNVLGTRQDTDFQDIINLVRSCSNPKASSWPFWTSELYDRKAGQTSFALPEGPFLNIGEQIFGQDVPRLAAQFLGGDRWLSNLARINQYVIAVPDRRARLVRLNSERNLLHVVAERRTGEQLFLCVEGTHMSGEPFSHVAELVGDNARVELPFSPQVLNVWVTLSDGYPLDHYYESPHRSSWGPENVLFQPQSHDPSRLLSVGQALAAGESEVLEFKPFVRFRPRDTKVDELLETANAFANTRGGDIYLGVSDHGEPQGIDRDLARQYGEKCRNSAECLRQSYERDLKKLFLEGLSPSVRAEFTWHDIAHRQILQVRIPTSTSLITLVLTGDAFRRAGATNRKLRTSEVVGR